MFPPIFDFSAGYLCKRRSEVNTPYVWGTLPPLHLSFQELFSPSILRCWLVPCPCFLLSTFYDNLLNAPCYCLSTSFDTLLYPLCAQAYTALCTPYCCLAISFDTPLWRLYESLYRPYNTLFASPSLQPLQNIPIFCGSSVVQP